MEENEWEGRKRCGTKERIWEAGVGFPERNGTNLH